MKKLLLGIAAIATVIAGPAFAADMPVRPIAKAPPMMAPAWNWTGTYFGIVGGGGWGKTNQTDTAGTTTGSYNQSGGTLGGTSGIQIQYGNWVFGEESDINWSSIKGTVTTPLCVGATCFTNLKSYGTARTRVGYAWDRWMVFATGGVAYGKVRAGQDSCPVGGINGFCGSRSEVGWTAGGGIEAFIVQNWSAKLEYLFVDLGTHYSYTPAIPVFVSEKASIIRAGIDYHFSWGTP